MIITLKDKNSVWVGVSTEASSFEIHKEDVIHEDNLKMWRVDGVENCLIASLHGGGIDLDRLRYRKHLGLSAHLNLSNLITKTVPKLENLFEECGMMDGKERWQTLVVAKGDKAFVILPNFTCCEVENFEVCSKRSWENVAYGALAFHRELPPVERITEAFRTLREMKQVNHFPIVIMNTKSNDRIVVYE